ncbi:uncharacterized protein LOC111412760 [Olea europaea var. sylvestris]|uniref:uncharacterized protein LOC111412760 n=1 Tax=Olea europaea var. sylvestris TaxID=158386 RepID=UPI000C1D4FA8|nr:uncharacterized protein LOC111412760 [Olea europaea var. sylvestris]
MTSTKVDIEIWNGKGDFTLWSQKMKALLMQHKCVKTLDEFWEEEIIERKRNKQIDTTWSLIFLHPSNSVIREVGKTETAEEIWTKLESLYKTKSLPNKCYLWKQFFIFKFDPHLDLEANLDRFNKLTQNLTNSSETLSGEQQAIALLSALPEKYKDLRNALE